MAMTMTEEMSASLHRGLSEWWSEETEYIFQRIERWAALARGYNRLRSERLSRGRMTMHEEQEPRWSISSNKIVIEDPNWCPRFHNLRRSHQKTSRADENCRINCCGTFNYQSSSKVDSNCLEDYRYDHSIYFKTIGDIKNSKKEEIGRKEVNDGEILSINSDEENIEWEAKNLDNEFCKTTLSEGEEDSQYADINQEEDDHHEYHENHPTATEDSTNTLPLNNSNDIDQLVMKNVWPIVNFTKLSLDTSTDNNFYFANNLQKIPDNDRDEFIDSDVDKNDDNNNLNVGVDEDSTDKMIRTQIDELTGNQNSIDSIIIHSTDNSPKSGVNYLAINRTTNLRKSRRNSRMNNRQPVVATDNNVLWSSGFVEMQCFSRNS